MMLPYISHTTNENANRYDLDIYVKGSYDERRVDEIAIAHDANILCRIYIDDSVAYVQTYDDRIDLSEVDLITVSNKKVRHVCRIIANVIGTLSDE